MKHLAIFLLVFTAVISGCKDKTYLKYTANAPVYMDYATFRASVTFEGPRSIETKGNIYTKDGYLFIVEPHKGIHFIDNTNPSSPHKTGFLKIAGCTNMSIRGHYLYANHLIDLVVVDISSISNPTVVGRTENIFPQALPPITNNLPIVPIDKQLGVVVGWEERKVKEEVQAQYYPVWNNCPECEFLAVTDGGIGSGGVQGSATSISGSITQFTIANDHLYAMDNNRLIPVNLSNPTSPVPASAIPMGRVVETLFPSGDHLFLGTTTGMIILSIGNPESPTEVSVVNHVTACDPVVVQGNYAYVTIRTGTNCAGSINELQIVDISNIASPVVVAQFPMTNPHGLGIDGNRLFICDGSAGLKLFDASTPAQSGNHLIQQFAAIQATDIIPYNNTAIVIGDHGLYQYDYSNPNNLQLLSTIPFN